MSAPITAAVRARIIALGREGLRWKEVALTCGVDKKTAASHWCRSAGPEDRVVRGAAVAVRRIERQRRSKRQSYHRQRAKEMATLAREPAVMPPIGPDIFAGFRFADDPRAAADRGSSHLPSPVPAASEVGSSLAW